MANYQQNLLDYITKTISESLNEVQITQAYSLATILEVLQPTHYKTQFFLAKLYFMMEFWSKVEFYSTQAINSLELVDFRNKNEDSLLGDIYYCKLKAQAFLNKPEEIKVTLKLLESKGIYHKILDKINQILPKFDETHLFKYVKIYFSSPPPSISIHNFSLFFN